MTLNTSWKRKCSPIHVANTRATAHPLSLAQLTNAHGREGMGRSRQPCGSCMHREIFSLATTFGPVSFLSLCHHWLKVNTLIFECLPDKGRKLPGRQKANESTKKRDKVELPLSLLFLAIVLRPHKWATPIWELLPSLPRRLRHFRIFLLLSRSIQDHPSVTSLYVNCLRQR